MQRKIEITVSCAGLGFSYHKGEIAEVPSGIAKQLISDGYAKPAKSIERAINKDNVQTQNSGIDIPVKPHGSKKPSKGKRKHR